MTQETKTEEVKSSEGIILAESYPFECAFCGKTSKAGPSLFMRTGMGNVGRAECPDCDRSNYLAIDVKTNDRMIAYKSHEDLFKNI